MKNFNIIYLGSGHCPVVATVRANNPDEAIEKSGYDFDDYMAIDTNEPCGSGPRFTPDEEDLMTW